MFHQFMDHPYDDIRGVGGTFSTLQDWSTLVEQCASIPGCVNVVQISGTAGQYNVFYKTSSADLSNLPDYKLLGKNPCTGAYTGVMLGVIGLTSPRVNSRTPQEHLKYPNISCASCASVKKAYVLTIYH